MAMKAAARTILWIACACALALLAGRATAQTNTTVTIDRGETSIVITNRARAADGARTLGNNRNCEEGILTSIFYGPTGLVETRIDETVLTSTVAVVRAPRSSDEGGDTPQNDAPQNDAPQNQETLELFDADVVFNRPGCLEEITMAETPQVTLQQGRTTIVGSRFFLDQETDIATMDGPIRLTRRAEGDSPALEAEAEALAFDIETEHSVLTGGVRVVSEGRISEADELELNEAEGVAVLRGSPARSSEGGNVLEGETLLYFLDSNDVVVVGNVKGTITLDDAP